LYIATGSGWVSSDGIEEEGRDAKSNLDWIDHFESEGILENGVIFREPLNVLTDEKTGEIRFDYSIHFYSFCYIDFSLSCTSFSGGPRECNTEAEGLYY
jgi:hypothetical protein